MVLEINEMINQEKDIDKRTILKKLRMCNKEASEHMGQFHKSFAQKYREMFAFKNPKPFWAKARRLLKKYFTIDGVLICPICNKPITGSFTLHHSFYPKYHYNIFVPIYCEIIHNKCHKKGVPKRR